MSFGRDVLFFDAVDAGSSVLCRRLSGNGVVEGPLLGSQCEKTRVPRAMTSSH